MWGGQGDGSLVNRRAGNPAPWQEWANYPSFLHAQTPEKLEVLCPTVRYFGWGEEGNGDGREDSTAPLAGFHSTLGYCSVPHYIALGIYYAALSDLI